MPDTRPIVVARDVLVGWGATADSAVCPPISGSIDAGGALAVVGANGTGKSTFLRAVAGLLSPFSGTVEVFGSPVDEASAQFRAAVAVVLDDDSYLPALTVREHLLLVARAHGLRLVSDMVTDVVTEFGLVERQRALPTSLSSGQRRRLLLAAAFVRPRRLLVLDEPEQRLDAGMRDRLAARLVDERAAGTGVVLATHDPVLVREVASTAVVIGEDRVRLMTPRDAAAAIEAL